MKPRITRSDSEPSLSELHDENDDFHNIVDDDFIQDIQFNPSKIVRDFARRWAKKVLSRQGDKDGLDSDDRLGNKKTSAQTLRQRTSRLASWAPAPTLEFLEKNRDKGRAFVDKKKAELERKMKEMPFIRTVDKVAFTLGVVLMVATALQLNKPDFMYVFYTALIFPLLITRFLLYHRQSYHYFMLDFCYYVQVVLLMFLYIYPENPLIFQMTFCLSNGPLVSAIVMWKNSLVFHDLDKLTSIFIHIYPPIVTYCLRWWCVDTSLFTVCKDDDCSITLSASFVWPLILYSFWQFCYILKTEILDRTKFQKNDSLMTSVRWFSRARPHPVYKFLVSKGVKINPVVLLIAIQFIYTIVTLAPTILLYKYYMAHTLYLTFVSLVAVWNGANFYFEVFTHSYAERLKRLTKEITESVTKEAPSEADLLDAAAAVIARKPIHPDDKHSDKHSDGAEEATDNHPRQLTSIAEVVEAAVEQQTQQPQELPKTPETPDSEQHHHPSEGAGKPEDNKDQAARNDSNSAAKQQAQANQKYWTSWGSFVAFWLFFLSMAVFFYALIQLALSSLTTPQ
eukprot:TRINITY_DN6321_c0_g2_i1.p1 TRINITY_DN6321_c0_g2~~TRINITY_DN6321_c0_g2_i1.p1  ORF type:complete len:577 (-),score=105.53 TRINITY_DN6321_c0_g2_i1:170-1867(-)